MDLTGKKVIVVGAGISGFAAAKLAKKLGATVIMSDANENVEQKHDLKPLRDAGVEIVLGKQTEALFKDADLVIISPAVPRHIPIFEKVGQSVPIISEVEFAYKLAKAPIFAVTGTNGKTTTTMLLGELMKTIYGKNNVGVGGNIGTPLCEECYRIGEDGCIVAEISSYQMEASSEFTTKGAAILNVTPDHLARHKTMDVYQAEKEKVFAHHTKDDFLVLNYDDERTRSMAQRAKSTICFFSSSQELEEGAFVKDGQLVIRWHGMLHVICRVDEMQIKGAHNIENALAAVSLAFLAGGDTVKMAQVLKDFAPVEHRIEPVRTLDGVTYYNDSKATNPEAANKAIGTFEHIILIAGGDDKKTPLDEFYALVNEHVDKLILVGDATARFEAEALKHKYPAVNIYKAGYSMEKAVELAHDMAKAPQVVLLSPACASFDMYDGYEARGRDFKRIVNELK
ncbi:UDP-N-acetylmuramoyl-L-alanine--D-glutamate ligase [Megamonas hypermegale]|uniref:UDP-N-acetylmuramoyl-L-alanine--D-glutamate ligase n=1 Tax=Megamonas hypermegale TaxID=158847 RepID=UPI00195AC9A3|nr:UDP-N-acetylmuramoyl-L-alanine--D-glutamate ligase [Megamonas hypermegale]MBM6760002.1 UDP-N-acetylmuramoyl-L-alanine--D-glutamate ligase [Megamonas hypermegale]